MRMWDISTGQCCTGPRYNKEPLWSVASSPDGRCAALGGSNGTLFVRDIDSGKLLVPKNAEYTSTTGEMMSSNYQTRTIAWFPNGLQFASAGADYVVRIWSAETGDCIGDAFVYHTGTICSIDISSDGSSLASGSEDKTVCLWNRDSRELALDPLTGHTDTVTAVIFTPDDARLISGSNDGTIREWDRWTGSSLRVVKTHEQPEAIQTLSLSPDGFKLANGSTDGTVHLWDWTTDSSLAASFAHSGRVEALCFSPDGRHLFSGSDEHTVRVWDVVTEKDVHEISYEHDVRYVDYAPDGSTFLTVPESRVCIYDASNRRLT
ncbi:WD40 repeat-like protein [Coniophora puteana RWD-64-598 SS2]|uniref:WD40 repeat-like protein n=1 Tax=Coniophora puteana (strain RWD-64-598) TaxID=741705 RepID=A0A5M3N4Q6_CONPW|nr:WD40 repeat-like protein [Coniophora puteana RWD-64-598 SS2]EIW85825.1 WD40 repeat-like protein [Coniophora puteana RWD-64-598 SS2]